MKKLSGYDFTMAVLGGGMMNALVMSVFGMPSRWQLAALLSGAALVGLCLLPELVRREPTP